MSEHKIPIPSMLYNAAVGGHVTSSQQIIDENLNREQQDINEEVAAVPYNATIPNGMGKIVLKKNDNFKQVVEAQTDGNTIFIIKYDFTLTSDVTVPANCVLKFDGGSLSGAYTITGNNTGINAGLVKIFNTDITLAGSWNVIEAYPEWFGAKGDGVIDDTLSIRKAVDLSLLACSCIVFSKGTYIVGTFDISDNEGGYNAIQIKSNLKCIGKGGIIKVKDRVNRQGFAFRSIFSSVLNTWVENITFIGVHVDLNGTNNLYPSGTDRLMSCCAVKMFYPNGKILIKDCYFENGPGAHFLALGYVKDCIISGCTFKNCADAIQGNTNCYDHSSILVAGKNIEITDNKFINDNQSYNATAIEVETNNAVTKGNIVDRYGVGYMIASVGVSKTDTTIFAGNVIYNTWKPIELWNDVENSGNIIINNNIINQNFGDTGNTIINMYNHVGATVKNIMIENNIIYDSRETAPSSSDNVLMCNGYIQWLTFKNNIVKNIVGGILLNNGCKHIFVENNIFDNVIRTTNVNLKGFLIVQSESAISEDINIINNRISAASVEGVNPANTIGIWVLSKHKSITIKDNKITGFGTPIHTEYANFSEGNDRTINISNAFIKYSNAAPTTGEWTRGNIVFNTAPSANGVFAWSCISSGTPGTWKEVKIEA